MATLIRLLTILMSAGLLMASTPAHAFLNLGNIANLNNPNGFNCSSTGEPTGRLFEQQQCTISTETIFSGTICTIEQTLSEILSKLYCAMQSSLIGPITIVLTISVIVFGIMFITGMTRFTATEAMKLLFKIVLVWAFATQAPMAIGLAYKFFVTLSQEGISIVLSALAPGSGNYYTGDSALRQLDTIVWNAISPSVSHNAAAEPLDQETEHCQNVLMGIFLVFLVVIPPLFMMVAYLLIQTIMVFTRALLGYVLAIAGLTFLMTLSPIFISFALFRPTEELFRKWLQYLISFALQMIIVFAFIALMQLISFDKFLNALLHLVRPYTGDGTLITNSAVRMLIGKLLPCGICEYELLPDPNYHMTIPVCKSDPVPANEIIAPMDIISHPGFVYMVVTKLIALSVVMYVMEAFLRNVPEIAKQLAGTPYGARLGGAVSADAITGRFAGIEQTGVPMAGGRTLKGVADQFKTGFVNTPGMTPSKVFGALTSARATLGRNLQRDMADEVASMGRGSPDASWQGTEGALSGRGVDKRWLFYLKPR